MTPGNAYVRHNQKGINNCLREKSGIGSKMKCKYESRKIIKREKMR